MNRKPTGPELLPAAVDLTPLPGHLVAADFEQLKQMDTGPVRGGQVPPEVAGFSLSREELSFESVLSLADAANENDENSGDEHGG